MMVSKFITMSSRCRSWSSSSLLQEPTPFILLKSSFSPQTLPDLTLWSDFPRRLSVPFATRRTHEPPDIPETISVSLVKLIANSRK